MTKSRPKIQKDEKKYAYEFEKGHWWRIERSHPHRLYWYSEGKWVQHNG